MYGKSQIIQTLILFVKCAILKRDIGGENMELIYPEYYEKFHCIAGACPDSCCQEWDVEVDSESARRYRALEGSLGEILRANLYEEDGVTYLGFPDGHCPLQRQDGLCGLQAELGEQALCQVCKKFPRLTQDYGTFVELGLEMSCPEAARIILTEGNSRLVRKETFGGEPGDYDEQAMEVLRRTRPQVLELLADGRYSVTERLALMLLYGYQVQGELDGGEPMAFEPEKDLETVRKFADGGDPMAIVVFYEELEILTDRWRQQLAHPNADPVWFEGLTRFASYGIYRYYYQAVSDYDLVGRIKMVVAGCILAAFVAKDTLESQINTLQLYSKEIENDAENVDALLDGAYANAALTDRNLLGILL